ncbi:hypothetical protein JCM10213_007909 [Rhodosporidiobolus nylandii]
MSLGTSFPIDPSLLSNPPAGGDSTPFTTLTLPSRSNGQKKRRTLTRKAAPTKDLRVEGEDSSSGGEDDDDGAFSSPSASGASDLSGVEDEDDGPGAVAQSKASMKVKPSPPNKGKGKGKKAPAGGAPKSRAQSKQRRLLQEALKMGTEQRAGQARGGAMHGGRRTTMSCENCRQRKMKCSRHETCIACQMRGEVCVWKDGAPLNASKFATSLGSLTANKAEADRLHRLVRILGLRYSLRERALAALENRLPRATPTLSDLVDAEGREAFERDRRTEEKDAQGTQGKPQESSPLEGVEALLALKTPTMNGKPVEFPLSLPGQGGQDIDVDLLPLPVPPPADGQPAEAEQPAPKVYTLPPPLPATQATPDRPASAAPVFPSPDVVRPFGRPPLPRSATTSAALPPTLRVSIPQANGVASGPSSAALPPPSASASSGQERSGGGITPYRARAQTIAAMPTNGSDVSRPGTAALDAAFIPTAEHSFPHLPPFEAGAHLHPPAPPPPPHLYAYDAPYYPPPPYLARFPPHAISPGHRYPPPSPFPPFYAPQRADPTYFYPTIPSPLLSPSSVASLAALRQEMRIKQNHPAVVEQKRREHEARYDAAVLAQIAAAAEKEAQAQKEEAKAPDEAEKVDKGKRRAEDRSDGEEAAEEEQKAAQQRQRDLARRAAESWAAFAATGGSGDGDGGGAFAAVEPYKPLARDSDPMLSIVPVQGSGAFGPPSAGPSSAGANLSRRASWFLVSPVGSSFNSPRLTRRPLLTLDPTTPSLSALRTPSAGPLSSHPSAGPLGGLHSFTTGGGGPSSRQRISISPIRSAAPLTAVEEGLRPFDSLRAPDLLDDRFEPRPERTGAGGGDALLSAALSPGADWGRFEPVLERRTSEEEGKKREDEGKMDVDEDPGWETDGRSSVGRRSASVRSVGGRSAKSREGEDSEDESEEGSAEE